TWPDGSVTKTEFDYDAGFTWVSIWNTSGAGIYGRQVATRIFDFCNGSQCPLLRSSSTAYQWQSDSNYLTYNILDTPSSSITYDTAGTQVAKTLTYYDETALGASGVSVSRDTAPPNGSFRGHATTVKHWLNGSVVSTPSCPVSVTNGYLAQTMTYLETGMVSQSQDACKNATTMQYAATPYAGAYPTSVCNALSQCATKSYDLNTGQLAGVTDPNNRTTANTYDDIGRLANISYPDQGQSKFFYPDFVTVEKKQLL